MGKIHTNELIERYVNSDDNKGTYVERSRKSYEKPALYEYENKVGKEVIDMNVDELIGLIATLAEQKRDNGKIQLSNRNKSYEHIAGFLRGLFNYYIDNVELIRNPFSNKRLKGENLFKEISKDKTILTYDYLLELIKEIKQVYYQDRGEYVELIMLLYYSGFRIAREIATFTENQVNHSDRIVTLMGRTIHLTERCNYLLEKFAKKDTFVDSKNYHMVSYKGSYFKFITKSKDITDFENRTMDYCCESINRQITVYANNGINTNLSYTTLFWLGIYDNLTKHYGIEYANKMITSTRDIKLNNELVNFVKRYGIIDLNTGRLKKQLRAFVQNN